MVAGGRLERVRGVRGRRRGNGAAVTALLLAVSTAMLTSCTADPPPPVESTDSPKPTVSPTEKQPVVVAIDDVGSGFNPHLLSDQSPANSAVSALVLPSPFRPVPDPARPGGSNWIPDSSLVISADVTSQEPFTVTYQLRNEAQWSDGAPIAAEDFRYLWQQMISAPGVVDPAGYELIEDVRSSGGGKTVSVVMKAAYPAWRELFTDLLPSHLIKDSPGGFATGLSENIPVSGGHFHIKSIDRGRDEILLERNDRFWDKPATPDQILMRRDGTPSQLADSMRNNDTQIVQIHGGTATSAQLAAIPTVRTGASFQPRGLDLTLNGRVPELADVRVRKSLLELLDTELLAVVGAGSEAAAVPARSQVYAPSDPGYTATAPARPSREQVLAQLAEYGYVAETPTDTVVPAGAAPSTRLVRAGVPLTLVIGTPEGDDTASAVANTAADQLRGAGVDATVTSLPAEELYGESLSKGDIGAVVGWSRAGSDPATALASRHSCPPAVVAATQQNTETTGPERDAVSEAEAPSNLSGVCDPTLQPSIDAALRGVGDVPQALADADRRLWDLAAVLPIMQDRTLVAAGPGVDGVSLSGAVPVGIFSDAADWSRIKE
ncbi:ABC transporter family substrate-binding protein [Rhodococcus wratislaviensis]|uniref:ABC transporter family substrate-binding protein n=1 Tax=Rhodococcus wratislaviensis TaxID=44752 RepID=UPI0026E53A82|nr:ABC transporter family substrate-binding protein [Rhodococcus wratislaviensis]